MRRGLRGPTRAESGRRRGRARRRGAAVGAHRRLEAGERPLGRVADDAEAAGEAPAPRERARLESTASAPVAACSAARSAGSSTIRSAARIVPARPRRPRAARPPRARVPPRRRRAPRRSPSRGRARSARRRSRTRRARPRAGRWRRRSRSAPRGRPARRAASATVAQAKVRSACWSGCGGGAACRSEAASSGETGRVAFSRSASTPCSARSASRSSSPRRPRTARSRSGSRNARIAGRCPGRTSPTPCLPSAPHRSGRCRP